jgi:signal transduction histidine kinase
MRSLLALDFMPHGCCYTWNPALIRLHAWSDAIIALAYYSIPITLIYLVRRRPELQFDWIFVAFAVFIMACGTTHVLEIVNIWHATYWTSGAVKAVTAAASIVTAILLIRLVPKALALPSPQQLQRANEDLQQEIAERQQTTERVERLNEELRDQTGKQEAANKELEAFSYSVSHDLRAPLRNIQGFAEILQTEAAASLSLTHAGYLSRIADSAQRMGQLIDDLLAFSRMGLAELTLARVEMQAMAEETARELSDANPSRKIAWKIGPLPAVAGDASLLKQVWINLFSNAVKYTRDRPVAEIAVSCREAGPEWEFTVRDNGIGFDMEYAPKLFGIFERLHSPGQFEGTGVGLANVRRIVFRHGGRTWAEGRSGEGAAFSFSLPRTVA